MKNCGFSEEEAKSIESNYHELYKESDAYKADRLKQASKDGYSSVAFGLKVRTPILKQVLWDNEKTPYEAQAEARTVGNAMGQSYGLLNNRAQNEFLHKVREAGYEYDILPVALIHDALYFMVRNDPVIVKFVNDNLIKSMEWQELDEIKHDQVKLGAELDIYYPTWANSITLKNNLPIEEVKSLLDSMV